MAHQAARLKANDGSSVWLPAGIVVRIFRFLSANEKACTARLIDKATSQHFANHKTVRLSLPSPTHSFKQRWGRAESFRAYTREQRLELLCLTAASGSIANLEIALDNTGLCLQSRMRSELLVAAAAAGQLDVCKMLRARGCRWGGSLAAAAGGGHRHVCEWLLVNGCMFTFSAVHAAARGGHEDLVIWLLRLFREGNTGVFVDVGGLLEAAADGLSLAAFQQLHQQLLTRQQQGGEAEQQQQEEVISQMKEFILAAAAGSSSPDWRAKVEWLEGQGYPRTDRACYKAAACSPDEEAVSRLQWLCSRGYTPGENANATGEAASHGNLAALRFLIGQAADVPDTQQYDYYQIAWGGHLTVLQYLHDTGILLPEESESGQVALGAADMGHLPVMAWAVEDLDLSPDNSDNLLYYAAEGGSVELMSWLHERGWTWGRDTIIMFKAAGSGCEEAVEWLVEQGCPWPVDGEAYSNAASNGDLAMIRCLHRLGCPWGPPGEVLVDCICTSVPVLMLRCLVELGCPVDDWTAMVREAEERPPGEHRTALLMWLAEERQRQSLGAQQ